MSASEGQETTSAEESKPVPSKTVTRKGYHETDITAYNLTLSIHCIDCQGNNPKEPKEQHQGCVSKDDRFAAKKPGYFDTADFNTPKPRAVPRTTPWMHGLEDFFKAVPDGETPRIKLEGNFCQLAANEAKGLSKETVHSIFANMMECDRLDTDLWDFVYGLPGVAQSFEEPPVKLLPVNPSRVNEEKGEDGEVEEVFRVGIKFAGEKCPAVA